MGVGSGLGEVSTDGQGGGLAEGRQADRNKADTMTTRSTLKQLWEEQVALLLASIQHRLVAAPNRAATGSQQ